MKEINLAQGLMLRQNSASTRELTTQAREGYSKDGEIFMAENTGEAPNQKPINNNPSPEQQAKARTIAIRAYGDLEKLPFEQRRVVEELIKRGIPPGVTGGAGSSVDKTGIPVIDTEIDAMNNLIGVGMSPLNIYTKTLENISKLTGVDDTKKKAVIDQIRAAIVLEAKKQEEQREQDRPGEERERRFSLYFMPKDIQLLSENPTAWLDEEFNKLYALAEEGQELSSPLIQDTQNKVSQALDLIRHSHPEFMRDFIAQSTIRLHLLQMRTVIGYKSIENIKQSAHELRFHGLLAGMALEKGMVGAMFNRFQDLLESTRLSSNTRHHVMLEDAYKLQRVLIDEQMDFAKKGIGSFGSLKDITAKKAEDQDPNDRSTWDDFTWAAKMTGKQIKEDERMSDEQKERITRIKSVNAGITRSVRTAYDVFVSSQRMGVVVARGKYLLEEGSRYRSDPIGPLNVYNMEELLFEKFDMYSPQQEELMNRIRLDMADSWMKEHKESAQKLTEEQRLDLGKRLFRDIFAVPDFFSSGWRIEGVVQALEERFGKDRAKEFALFMRLQIAEKKEGKKGKGKETRGEVWEKIKTYRPEEIIRLFRERKGDKVKTLYDEMIKIDLELKLTDIEEGANRPDEEGGRGRDLTVYDNFKKRYGAIIGLLRQEGFNHKDSNGDQSPIQINLSKLTDEQKEMVDKLLKDVGGSGQQLVDLAVKMQEFIVNKDLVSNLLKDNEFADIYTRSIIVDDALLDKLEDEGPEINGASGNLGYSPLSKIIGGAGAGEDTLVRSWTDTENAAKAGNALLKFIKEEDLEKKTNAALEFAGSASMYNGLGARGQAEGVRHTIGTYLNLTKLDMAWDIIGINSLPFRIPASDAQRIFGVQAGAIGRDELRGSLDYLRGFLTSSITKARKKFQEDLKMLETSIKYDTLEKKAERKKQLEEEFKNDEKGAQKFYENLERLLENTGKDFWKRTGFRLLLYLMLAAIGETYMAGKASASK